MTHMKSFCLLGGLKDILVKGNDNLTGIDQPYWCRGSNLKLRHIASWHEKESEETWSA